MSMQYAYEYAFLIASFTFSGFLNALFAGLCGDRLTTIEMVLPVLLDKVLFV